MRAIVWVVAGLCSLASCAGADTIYVDAGGGGDYTTIQAGMDAAASGDTVVVAAGTYYISDPITYDGKEIVLRAEYTPLAIIDCQNMTRAVTFIGEGEGAMLLGFTIRNGHATSYGGAISCTGGAEPTISGLVITNCSSLRGGAIQVHESRVSVLDTVITDCVASEYGGGIYCYNSTGASFVGLVIGENTGGTGGGMYVWGGAPTVQLCTFYRNSGGGGGALHCRTANPMVLQTILAFSTAGKGIHCESAALPYVAYSDVYGNAGGDAVCGTSYQNGSEDPRFCDMDGDDVTLCANSWCLPGGPPHNPTGTLIGARGQGCGDCSSPVAPATWGAVKALYR